MEEEEEEEEPEYEGIGRADLLGEEEYEEEVRREEKVTFEDLKAGISSLIQSTQLLTQEATKKMPLPPSEPRPLYQVLEEV